MSDRVASDGDAVTTYRARLARSGGTRRPCLRLPDEAAVESGDLIRLVLDGTEYHAKVEGDAEGALIRGAADNRRLARADGEGANRLVEWVRGTDRETGQSVDLDEVTPGYLYGVRVPGRRAVYTVTRQPDSSLSSIAEGLDGDR
ncbi:hypothetical protein DU500_04715 [Haloplanus rubicundus]|uniref:Uncharacterized protein n=1 Tax=Haloplanus rubicundus TaxID=1547898 RepID=A0A345EAB0_9EURY|nr:hypothetical protein [Haloplanus rubicundus]AXG05793.1 hypothetical protein DU500_04715 [Haloplanus rubicundus]AXG09132.1 hypothetical protein DU484_04240 [Haloplanus rubicundus]